MTVSRRNALAGAAALFAAGTLAAAEKPQSTERPVRRTDYLLSENVKFHHSGNSRSEPHFFQSEYFYSAASDFDLNAS